MRFSMIILSFLLLVGIAFSGTPVIDGVFDGESVWGPPVAVADGLAGWDTVNVEKIYVTYDTDYAYFSALFVDGGYPEGWMRVAFAINFKSGGGWNDPWGQAVSYAYTPDDQKPDIVPIGRLQDHWAEFRTWNGSDWDGAGVNYYGADEAWADDYHYVECRLSKSDWLPNAQNVDVQFYVSGDNDTEHGTFDACPDDEDATSWNDPTELKNYALDVSIGEPAAIGAEHDNLPNAFELKQNYPNPFNNQTAIEFNLPRTAQISLNLFSANGRFIQSIVKGEMSAGTHRVVFNASHLASGVYYYQLKSGTISKIKKFILIK